jgi:hypothetical protein
VWLSGRFDVVSRQLAHQPNWWAYYSGLYESDGWTTTEAAIARLGSYCRSHRIGLLIVNYPELRQFHPYRFDRVNALVSQAAIRHGASYVDLYNAVRMEKEPQLWVTRLDPHPNSYAHKLFSEALLAPIEQMLDQYPVNKN